MKITPFVVGSGRAAQALMESFRLLEINRPNFYVKEFHRLARGQKLQGITKGVENPVLLIANPHGLHAQTLLDAEKESFKLIVVEKPAAVSLKEVEALRLLKTPVAVCHVYRQMWGIQKLKSKIVAGEFGQVIAIEGRYWQSSGAQRSLIAGSSNSWKNDVALSGEFDTLLDIGTHWIDAAMFLAGQTPNQKNIWKSYVNAESAHRDSHVQLSLDFPSGTRAWASISKTVHGAHNHFEINVIGSKKYASWKFLEPDQIEEGVGGVRSFLPRTASEALGSGHSPFHATGWLEGYVEILRQAFDALEGLSGHYPTLSEQLVMLDFILRS